MHSQAEHTRCNELNQQVRTGSKTAVDRFVFCEDPRTGWRGFSFGYYYFYFSFSNSSPFCAQRQMMAG